MRTSNTFIIARQIAIFQCNKKGNTEPTNGTVWKSWKLDSYCCKKSIRQGDAIQTHTFPVWHTAYVWTNSLSFSSSICVCFVHRSNTGFAGSSFNFVWEQNVNTRTHTNTNEQTHTLCSFALCPFLFLLFFVDYCILLTTGRIIEKCSHHSRPNVSGHICFCLFLLSFQNGIPIKYSFFAISKSFGNEFIFECSVFSWENWHESTPKKSVQQRKETAVINPIYWYEFEYIHDGFDLNVWFNETNKLSSNELRVYWMFEKSGWRSLLWAKMPP